MGGEHSHSHGASKPGYGKAFAIGIVLNITFVVAETLYGLKSNSLSLVADAGHNLGDVAGLVLAWMAVWLGKKSPSARYTYGLQSSSIIAALANAVLLLFVTGGICWEAFHRFRNPEAIGGQTVVTVAMLGIFINGISAWFFAKGSKTDLNIRGAFFHLMADAAVSLAVVISGLVILKTGWLWIDPLMSILVGIVIIVGSWGLLRDAVNLSLHAVPKHIDPGKVREFLAKTAGVTKVHDLHIWAMSTSDVSLSVHLLMKGGHPGDKFLKDLAHELDEHYQINHATFQIELGDQSEECYLTPDDVI